MRVQIKVKNLDLFPQYSSWGAGALDLRADIEEPLNIFPGDIHMVGTGIYLNFSDYHDTVGLLFPRSGLAHSHGLTLTNSVGLIDPDYQGEIKVSLRAERPLTIQPGDRIAQLVFMKTELVTFIRVNGFTNTTKRGENGFGSTGVS